MSERRESYSTHCKHGMRRDICLTCHGEASIMKSGAISLPEPKSYLYQNGMVDIEALQALERRVATLETDRFAYPVPVDTRIDYYEQQIEEISGKWQAAEENLKRMTFLRDEASLEYARQINSHSGLISTIAELREKLGVVNSVVEALNLDVSQRNAIIAEKNRELSMSQKEVSRLLSSIDVYEKHLPVRELTAFMEDAKLGALVRQMPDGGYLIRLKNALHACCNGESDESKEWIKQAGEAIGA